MLPVGGCHGASRHLHTTGCPTITPTTNSAGHVTWLAPHTTPHMPQGASSGASPPAAANHSTGYTRATQSMCYPTVADTCCSSAAAHVCTGAAAQEEAAAQPVAVAAIIPVTCEILIQQLVILAGGVQTSFVQQLSRHWQVEGVGLTVSCCLLLEVGAWPVTLAAGAAACLLPWPAQQLSTQPCRWCPSACRVGTAIASIPGVGIQHT
jgi:hypothetical protein